MSLQAIGSALCMLWLDAAWQGFALTAAVAALLWALPDPAPRVRYRIWAAAYLGCILVPLALAVAPLLQEHGRSYSSTPNMAAPPLLTLHAHAASALRLVWCAASLLTLCRFLAGVWGVWRLLRTAQPASPEWQRYLASLLPDENKRSVRLLVSENLRSPVAAGVWSPTILLPGTLLREMDSDAVAQTIRHELEHLHRRDHLAALLLGFVHCLVPAHPVLLWIERHLATTREMACDESVLHATAPRTYATTLTRIAGASAARRTAHAFPQLLGTRSQMQLRIEYILSPARLRRSGKAATAWAAALLLLSPAALVRLPVPVAFSSALAAEAPPPTKLTSAHLQPAKLLLPVPSAAIVPERPSWRRIARKQPKAVIPRNLLLARSGSSLRSLAASRPVLVPATPLPDTQAATVLVLWSDPQQGFYATLVFDLHSVPTAAGARRPKHPLLFTI